MLNHTGYAEGNALIDDTAVLLQTGLRPPDLRLPILDRVQTPTVDYWRYR